MLKNSLRKSASYHICTPKPCKNQDVGIWIFCWFQQQITNSA